MSIQKKSLISTLKSAKKANVASANTTEIDAKGAKVSSMRVFNQKKVVNPKALVNLRAVTTKSLKASHTKSLKSFK
jgi:hypothetical protein